uniref:Uncharacterized protein n=1 Tax=Aegilops tauschii subsp. strangulata TaxID=200361 RepID=A0A453ABQ6_AEGTS
MREISPRDRLRKLLVAACIFTYLLFCRLSATGALLDEDTSLWLSPGDNPADGGLLVGSNGDTYYMPPGNISHLSSCFVSSSCLHHLDSRLSWCKEKRKKKRDCCDVLQLYSERFRDYVFCANS